MKQIKSLKSKISFIFIFIGVVFNINTIAKESKVMPNKLQLIEQIESTIREINNTLQSRESEFKKSPNALAEFVDDTLVDIWSAEKTMTGLTGRKQWNSLKEADKAAMVQVFNDTLQRYVQEGITLYDGQTVDFIELKLSPKQTRGLLTIEVNPRVMPSFNIDLKVVIDENRWGIYDILIQGVSYIQLKRNEVRAIIKEKGHQAVIAAFREKNTGFIPSSKNKTQ